MELKILNGALRKRTIFSSSLTAAAFSDVFVVSEDNLKEDFKKVVKVFFKGEQNHSPLSFTMPPTRHGRRCKICLEC